MGARVPVSSPRSASRNMFAEGANPGKQIPLCVAQQTCVVTGNACVTSIRVRKVAHALVQVEPISALNRKFKSVFGCVFEFGLLGGFRHKYAATRTNFEDLHDV